MPQERSTGRRRAIRAGLLTRSSPRPTICALMLAMKDGHLA